MTISLFGVLVAFLIICLVFWAVRELAKAFEVPAKITAVVYVVLVCVVVLWLLTLLPGGPSVRIGALAGALEALS